MPGFIDGIIAEYKHECATTRKFLERLPDELPEWTPHPKSMTMRRLAVHVAEIPGWAKETWSLTEFLIYSATFKPSEIATREELLTFFDEKVASGLDAMKSVKDSDFMTIWTMKWDDNVVVSMPKIAVMRGFVLSHLVHHRAQLGVYMRMKEIALPSTYGPSADEK